MKITIFVLSLLIPGLSLANNEVYKVIDGDTFEVPLSVLPPSMKLSVRILGIDTPESTHRAKCEKEKELGLEVKEYVKERVGGAEKVELSGIKWDKYGGRINANVTLDGADLGKELISNGLAKEYTGAGPKPNWCD